MLNTQEHADLLAHFERFMGVNGVYAEKEPKELWRCGHIYCHGPTNDAFLAFRHGYAYGKSVFSGAGAARERSI